jgi:hypothetical protein
VRDITVSGRLLQPLTRRTNNIHRVVLAAVFPATVITSSLITRNEWVALERSISEIVGVLTPNQPNLVYLAYGVAIVALPFVPPCQRATRTRTRREPGRGRASTLVAHHRRTRATSNSDRAIGSPVLRRLGCGVERIERGIESALPAPVGLMVSLGRD